MVKILKNLKWFFKHEWYKYLFVLMASLLLTYILMLPPRYIAAFIEQMEKNILTKPNLINTFKMMLGIAIAIYILAITKKYILGNLFHKMFYSIKIEFLNAIFLQDGDFFEFYYPGDLIARATGDTHAITNVSTYMLFNLFDTVLMIIVSAYFMLKINTKLTLYSIIPLPIIFFVVIYLRPKISANWRQVRAENSNLNNLVLESVSNAKLVRGFVKEEEDEEKLSKSAEEAYKIERKSVLLRSVFGPTFRVVTLASQGIALIFGSFLIVNQELTVANLIQFNLYLSMFSWPLFRLGNQISFISQSGVAFDRVNEILSAEPVIKDHENALNLKEIETIEFSDLSFKYPNDSEYVLKNINLIINSGETIGIVGKTGSGKSTLVKQLLRQYPITDGTIFINDRNIEQYQKRLIRQNIAYVPQEHQLFSRTVLENIELGSGPDSIYSTDEVVKMADFEKDLPFLQDGLNTIVGEAGVTLSGGQKQRLSISRALYKNSEVLILDDSLSAVDGMTESNIIKNLKTHRANKTNIIVAHRLSAVEHADKIICLDEGEIVEEGTHQELMKNKKWYYEQYILQQMKDEEEHE